MNKRGVTHVLFEISEDVKEIVYFQEIDKLVGFCGKHACTKDCNVEVGEGENRVTEILFLVFKCRRLVAMLEKFC